MERNRWNEWNIKIKLNLFSNQRAAKKARMGWRQTNPHLARKPICTLNLK